MKGILLNITGNWAHFKRPETNNNPLSYDFITKTALIGMIGAVIGKNREEMKELFPILSEDLKYGVQIKNNLSKESWGFTFRQISYQWEKNPKQMEFIKNPDYDVMIGLYNDRSEKTFDLFSTYCQTGQAFYQPILGLHNCPANILFKAMGAIKFIPGTKGENKFTTGGFIDTLSCKPEIEDSGIPTRIGFDKIPTHQNHDFWNDPAKYVNVIYPYNGTISASGDYYEFNNDSQWSLI